MEKDNKGKCGVCEIKNFERNNYFYGKLMTARDFKDEQCYFNEKRWLINRMVHGWGVVCGLDVVPVSGKENTWQVTPGLAFDCCGREILLCKESMREISAKELEGPCRQYEKNQSSKSENWVICLEYRDCKTELVGLSPQICDQKEISEHNRIRDSFKIRLRYEDDVCISEPYGEICPLTEIKKSKFTERENCQELESLHHYLCTKLKAKDACPKCHENECLILARLVPEGKSRQGQAQTAERQQEQTIPKPTDSASMKVDPCYKRRLVFRNPLLYDLIYCYHGDLPRIVDLNWRRFHGTYKDVYWEDFYQLVERGLIVTFDRSMNPATLNKHTFLFGVYTIESGTGYRVKKYIPAESINYKKDRCIAHFIVDKDWFKDEMVGKNSEIRDGTDVEIILRGSLILDTNGKALDGDAIGHEVPTGNGTPAGDFVSCFSVLSRKTQRPSMAPGKNKNSFPDF